MSNFTSKGKDKNYCTDFWAQFSVLRPLVMSVVSRMTEKSLKRIDAQGVA